MLQGGYCSVKSCSIEFKVAAHICIKKECQNFRNRIKQSGNVTGFTKYKATIVVRLASDNKFYLYDIIDIKK